MADFTPEERTALETVDRLSKGVSKVTREIANINRSILRLKKKRDGLVVRKDRLDSRLTKTIETIDTSKTKEVQL